MAKKKNSKKVETITHDQASRRNIPTAEFQSVMREDELSPIRLAYERRNRDLDPQLVWRGKDEQDWSDLVVQAPPLYIQDKVHPKVLIDDLMLRSEELDRPEQEQPDLFSDFNGIPEEAAKTDFYQHDANWSNRMILGDSLQVMASLAEREGLRGQVQCIYLDPPYGIKFNSNFQWSTTSRDVKDGKADHITREPEQVKAFRDTWRDGIHSYLTYLRDRLTVARDLLHESGSIFIQIGDENVHLVRSLAEEVFGSDNFVSLISVTKTTSSTNEFLAGVADYIIWFSKRHESCKYRQIHLAKIPGGSGSGHYNGVVRETGERRAATKEEKVGNLENGWTLYTAGDLQSASVGREKGEGAASWFHVFHENKDFTPTMQTRWKTNETGMQRLAFAGRLIPQKNALRYMRKIDDFAAYTISNVWTDTGGASDKRYVVETSSRVVARCILMTTDPGDLVLDPTCGSGTTAYMAEQWGRRWITIDTSRVALALARARVMGARYPYYLLADSPEGQQKEAELSRIEPSTAPTYGNIRQGFVYQRVPHITLKAIANNAEIDVIWDQFQEKLEPLRRQLNQRLGRDWEEWQIPREPGDPWPDKATKNWQKIQTAKTDRIKANALKAINGELKRSYTLADLPDKPFDLWTDEKAIDLHAQWWQHRIARQQEMDASIAAKADYEYLYDKPYEDNKRVRVAGPFTVESLSPHRVMTVGPDDELIDPQKPRPRADQPTSDEAEFTRMILENLKTAGVQQAHKEDKINFRTLIPWPGEYICAEGRYYEGGEESGIEKRAAIFIGPEFGTVSRPDLVAAAREAAEAGFDSLIACAFNYDAHSSEFEKLGRIPVLKARMNADLHMADDLKNTGKGNLFVIFGEPDIEILEADDDQIQVRINGVDVFHPNTGEIRSDGSEGIACWFIDTNYNEESFFVRQAYFLGANDPYKALKTSLRSEINQEAWETLNNDISRPFDKPESGRIAVKVINHLGDEVMKVYRVE